MSAKSRVAKIKSKYGVTAFQRWGKTGGSPVLKAWKAHKIIIVK